MAIHQLIACSIITNDILKASVYFGTEVFRTEILRCVTQFVKQKKCYNCFLNVRLLYSV